LACGGYSGCAVRAPLFNPASFARLVRVEMASRNLSYRDLEAEVGVDQATLHRVCKRERPPSVETYLRLVDWMGASE
jgi:transcriptional regulator with XRE-family HTH domain